MELRVPGDHNVLNALAALAALPRGGRGAAQEAAPASRSSRAPARRFEEHGRTAAARSCTTTTPTTRPRCAPRSRPRGRSSRAAWSPRSSRISTRARRCSRASSARALALADLVVVLDVYRARERPEDFPGVSGFLVAQAAADAAAGRPVWWMPTLGRRRADAARRAERGRPAAHARRGRRRRAGAEAHGVSTARPASRRDYPLARLTTIRTGGPGDFFARPDSPERLAELLAWADAEGDPGRSGGVRLEPAR